MGFEEIREAIIRGDAKTTPGLIQAELDAGTDVEEILRGGMIDAMGFVGLQFEKGEVYVPEMLIAARAMKAGLAILKPLLLEKGTEPAGRVAIGTVRGDLHDIGKNLVAMMLEGAGFEVIDLGVDVSPDRFVAAVDSGIDIVAMSALLTTTMPQMRVVIAALTEAGLRDKASVMVGGAPLTQAFADDIGADGYAADASSASRLAKRLLGIE